MGPDQDQAVDPAAAARALTAASSFSISGLPAPPPNPATPPAGPGPAHFALIDAIESLAATHALDRIVDIVRLAARRISGADGVTFILREGNLCHYVDEDAIAPLWKGKRFLASECISGWVMGNRLPVVIPDVMADPRIPKDVYRQTFVKSMLMVPVGVERPLAAIGAYWAGHHVPDDNEITLLESLARAATTAIANVTLENALREATAKTVRQAAAITRAHDETRRETDRRLAAEDHLRQSQKMDAIGHLTGGIAHDFNNLLSVIIGNTELALARSADDEALQELGGEVLRSALAGADLIRSLLAFARRQPLEPRQVDVNALIENTVSWMKRALGAPVEISLALQADLWPVVIDEAQLEASIANLVTNARDAMEGGGLLCLRTENRRLEQDKETAYSVVPAGDHVLVEVSDTGSGMAADVMDRMFDPFFTTKPPGKGTGLGLSMVFGFVKQSNGHIDVESSQAEGTTFRIYIPRMSAAPEHQAASSAMSTAEARPGQGEHILVADDNADVRRTTARQLTELGYRVTEARDAASAMILLDRGPVDLLITDVVMPGGPSGHELATAVRERWPDQRIILTSGFSESIVEVRQAARLRTLHKPYRGSELAAVVHQALSS